MKKITKAVLSTILYIIFFELISLWGLAADVAGIKINYSYYFLITSLLNTVIIYFFVKIIKTSESCIPQKTNTKWYLLALILGAFFVFIQTPLKLIYNFIFDTNYFITYNFHFYKLFQNINIISLVILIPISEELFFREYIQNDLQKKFKPSIAIIIASLLFASCHLPYQAFFIEGITLSAHKAYIVFFGGLISGFLYFKSHSVGPSALMHASWNLVAFLIQ